MPFGIVLAAVAFVTVSVAVDVRSRRIPNFVSGSAILAGILLNSFYFGLCGTGASATGLLLAAGLLFLPFAMGGIGGGDVKMMAAVGSLVGPRLALASLVIGVMFGGLIMTAHLVRSGRLSEKLGSLRTMVSLALLHRSIEPLKVSAAEGGTVALPYSIPLGAGTLSVVLLASRLGLPS